MSRASLREVAHATRGAPLPAPRPIDLSSAGPPARAVASGRSLYFPGPAHGPARVDEVADEKPAETGGAGGEVADPPFDAGAFAALPIPSTAGCLGVVGLAYSQWQPFHTDEREFLEAVVRQASLAFDRARLTAEQERLTSQATFFAGAARRLAEADDLRQTLDRLADLPLQLADLRADRRLAERKSLCRLTEVLQVRRGDEGTEHLEVHAILPPDHQD